MRIFLAGATGVMGHQLVPRLAAAGHTVIGTTRHADKAELLRGWGAETAVVDPLDAAAVTAAVLAAEPDVVIHQLTALAGMGSPRTFERDFAMTNRLRTEGTDILLAAAAKAGVRRVVAQSFGGWPYARTGSWVKTEDAPLDPTPAAPKTHAAIRYLEQAVTGYAEGAGLALRYGYFYGPGTSLGAGGPYVAMLHKRAFPVVGSGAGTWSFCHIADAATATVAAVERGAAGVYNIGDDEPATVRVWLPELARALGAPAPRKVPGWLARPLVGPQGMLVMTSARGMDSSKAKRELGWAPAYPTWREGFRALGDDATTADRAAG
jgi:2-alkyl-3-oxoalkanoate reductase